MVIITTAIANFVSTFKNRMHQSRFMLGNLKLNMDTDCYLNKNHDIEIGHFGPNKSLRHVYI